MYAAVLPDSQHPFPLRASPAQMFQVSADAESRQTFGDVLNEKRGQSCHISYTEGVEYEEAQSNKVTDRALPKARKKG